MQDLDRIVVMVDATGHFIEAVASASEYLKEQPEDEDVRDAIHDLSREPGDAWRLVGRSRLHTGPLADVAGRLMALEADEKPTEVCFFPGLLVAFWKAVEDPPVMLVMRRRSAHYLVTGQVETFPPAARGWQRVLTFLRTRDVSVFEDSILFFPT